MAVQLLSADDGRRMFEDNLELIKARAKASSRRYRLNATHADEFQSEVFVKLIEGDYRRLRAFKGESTLATFLRTVVEHLCQDYLDAAFGTWHPSATAISLGPLAIAFERLTIRDRHTFDDAFELLRTDHGFTISYAALEALAARLPRRIRRQLEPDGSLIDLPAPAPLPDAQLIERKQKETYAKVFAALDAAIDAIEDVEDRLMMKLLFHDGESMADIARVLNRPHKPLFARRDRQFAYLRKTLKAQGFDQRTIRELLDWDRQ